MRTIKYFVFTCLLLFITSSIVNAESCDSDDIKRLKEIAKNVTVSYVFNDNYVDPDTNQKIYNSFDIEIFNLTDEIYVVVNDNFDHIYKYSDTKNGNLILQNNIYGTYDISFYSTNCATLLKNINLEIPKFNIYSLDERCKESKYSKLDICDEWYQGVSNVADSVDYFFDIDGNNSKFNYLYNNLLYIVPIVVFFLAFIIVLVFKRYKKRWSLE